MRNFFCWLSVLATVLAFPGAVSAATPSTEPTSVARCEKALGADSRCQELYRVGVDTVPSTPAFAILNVTPNQVIRPSTPRQFGAALLNGTDPNGNIQSGLALDANPFMIFGGQNLSIQEYQENWVARTLANTQLSVATTKGNSDEDKAYRGAVGLHVILWNKADPRLDPEHRNCVYSALTMPPGIPSPDPNVQDQIRKGRQVQLDTAMKTCHEKFKQRASTASAWSVGVAGIGTSADGEFGSTRYGGGGAWMSFAQDLSAAGGFQLAGFPELRGQLTFHGRWRDNEVVPDPAQKGKLLRQDTAVAAAALRLGGPDLNFTLEPAFLHSQTKGRGTDNYFQLTVSAEINLFDNVWFTVSGGGTTERDIGGNTAFVTGKFKYAFDQNPRK